MIAARKREAYLKTALYGTVGLAGIATVGTMAWLGIQAYALVGGAAEDLAAKWEDAKEAAQNIWSGPETVATTQPPPSDIDRSWTVGDDLVLNEFLDGILGDTPSSEGQFLFQRQKFHLRGFGRAINEKVLHESVGLGVNSDGKHKRCASSVAR